MSTGIPAFRGDREGRRLLARSMIARQRRTARMPATPRPARGTNEETAEPCSCSTSRLPGGRTRRGSTGCIERRQALVAEELVLVARRRLIPDVDTTARRHARRLLDRWIADRQILSDGVVTRQRKDNDSIRVAHRRVGLDDVVVAHDAETKVNRRTGRVAVAARLVPPERVIVALDSYAAARRSWRAIPHRDVTIDADSR